MSAINSAGFSALASPALGSVDLLQAKVQVAVQNKAIAAEDQMMAALLRTLTPSASPSATPVGQTVDAYA